MAVIVTALLAAVLVYVAEDIPGFGDPEAPAIKSVKLFSLPATGWSCSESGLHSRDSGCQISRERTS